ncbi:hypothetical protein HDU96_001091 [Phlyctochytrium bullatum]|nr:hypothetical protein HDU96_001091 [Phlyctochytrium bullatum]
MDDDQEPTTSKQVQVRFKTRTPRYAVPETPILIPVDLRRFGLSEVVNHLLGRSETPVPFDFIIDGQFLRTTLEEYIDEHKLSTESVLEIEYLESTLPPQRTDPLPHDDWVSDVSGPRHNGFIATSSFDGTVAVWSQTGTRLATLQHHDDAGARCVAWLRDEEGGWGVVTGGEDERVVVSRWDGKGLVRTGEWVGHEGSVDCVSVSKEHAMVATGSWDRSIKLWNPRKSEEDDDEAGVDAVKVAQGKRKRMANREVVVKHATMTLGGSAGGVTSVCFSKHEEFELFSGGWDHSLRIWDIVAATNTTTLPCECVILDIDQSPLSNLLASGHSDGKVRLWDPRDQSGGLVVKLRLSLHASFVSRVSWCPGDAFKLASASYDGSVKVWDIRSTSPLHTVKASVKEKEKKKKKEEEEPFQHKVYALEWDGDKVFFGGESSQLEVYSLPLPSSSSSLS